MKDNYYQCKLSQKMAFQIVTGKERAACTQKMLIKLLYFYTRSDTLFKMAMHTRNT